MKNFIKKQFILITALALSVFFSAYSLSKKTDNTLNDNWHPVDTNGNINPDGQTNSPPNCPSEGEEYCALKITLKPGITHFPETVEEFEQMLSDEELTLEGATYRE